MCLTMPVTLTLHTVAHQPSTPPWAAQDIFINKPGLLRTATTDLLAPATLLPSCLHCKGGEQGGGMQVQQ